MLKQKKEIYLLIIWVILILVVLFVFFLPNLKKMKTISENVKESEKKLEAMQKSGQSKEEAEVNYRLIKENISKIDGIIPKRGEELPFITALEEIASKNHLEQKMNIFISKDNKPVTGEIITLPFQLTLDGNFYNFFNYLNDLELSEYYLNIQKIQINQSLAPTKTLLEEENILTDANNVHLILDGISYWQ